MVCVRSITDAVRFAAAFVGEGATAEAAKTVAPVMTARRDSTRCIACWQPGTHIGNLPGGALSDVESVHTGREVQ